MTFGSIWNVGRRPKIQNKTKKFSKMVKITETTRQTTCQLIPWNDINLPTEHPVARKLQSWSESTRGSEFIIHENWGESANSRRILISHFHILFLTTFCVFATIIESYSGNDRTGQRQFVKRDHELFS
jgi:hypothetical protein